MAVPKDFTLIKKVLITLLYILFVNFYMYSMASSEDNSEAIDDDPVYIEQPAAPDVPAPVVDDSINEGNPVPDLLWYVHGYDNFYFHGNIEMMTSVKGALDYDWPGRPIVIMNNDFFSIRATSPLKVDYDGYYDFIFRYDDIFRFYLDGELITHEDAQGWEFERRIRLPISKGEHTLKIEYQDRTGGARLFFDARPVTSESTAKNQLNISGTLSLPFALKGDEKIILFAEDDSGNEYRSFPDLIKGADTAAFNLNLPSSTDAYRIGYIFDSQDYVKKAYIAEKGMTYLDGRAFKFTGSSSNLQLSLMKGQQISGKLVLTGIDRLDNDLDITVFAINNYGIRFRHQMTLKSGAGPWDYSFTVPLGEDIDERRFKIGYEHRDLSFYPRGYYSKEKYPRYMGTTNDRYTMNSTTPRRDMADLLQFDKTGSGNIDLVLVPGEIFQGAVAIGGWVVPLDDTIPIRVILNDAADREYLVHDVEVGILEKSTNLFLPVPMAQTDSAYKLIYYTDAGSRPVTGAYFGEWDIREGAHRLSYAPLITPPHDKIYLITTRAPFEHLPDKDDLAEQEADRLIASMPLEGLSEFEKVLYIHDALVPIIDYQDKKLDIVARYSDPPSLFGALIRGVGICNGYSVAFDALLRRAGIETILVDGTDWAHMWNAVRIDGKWYHIDLTWDDRGDWGNYDYFLLSDAEMIKVEGHASWEDDVPPSNQAFYLNDEEIKEVSNRLFNR